MAFDINNIREVGGPGNSQSGGQMYSIWSSADAIGTMLADSYLDDLSYKLKARDCIILTGTDGAIMAQIEAVTAGVVTTSVSMSAGSGIQALSGAGAVNITDALTNVTSTGTDALTLADGAVGQIKTICLVVDGGTATLTPATGSGYTTIAFADAGDSVVLMWVGTTGWAMIGHGGLTGGPVAS